MISAFRYAQYPSQKILEGIRIGFLLFNCVGFLVYPIELTILQHWSTSFGSKIPYLVSAPGLILTVAILINRKNPVIYWAFMIMMILMAATGFAGFAFHLIYNFNGKVDLGFAATTQALEGAAPTMAALAFTHIGLTGLICAYRAR
ncbi:MAG TPA: hypothetical protein VHN99_06285 [Deinococcales bacterium]|nr:hypothetical protein [Deinococcales bacterium]